MAHPETYAQCILPRLAEKTQPFRIATLNTWGDGIMCASRNPRDIARLALDLRDVFQNTNFARDGLPSLGIRIALHAATAWVGVNPITARDDIFGKEVNTAARIEPVVQPNHICATKEFAQLMSRDPGEPIIFSALSGRVTLAKNWGSEELFDLRRKGDLPFQQQDQSISMITSTLVNPRYIDDIDKLDGRWKLEAAVSNKSICVVVGDRTMQELLDRPIAAFLRDEIDSRGKHTGDPFKRAIVVTSSIWRNELAEKGMPTIAVGGGGKNEAWDAINSWAKIDKREPFPIDGIKGLYALYCKFNGRPNVALWGTRAVDTRACVVRYINAPKGLAPFLDEAWQ